jgi:acetyltransferase
VNNIESIINPKSIAVVGATNRPGSVGLASFKNLLQADYKGVLYPVHPKSKSVQGVKAYPSILDIPDEVEMAMIIVATDKVASVLEEAAQKQVKGCIIISAGFKEVGGQGVELEQQLKSLANKHGIRLVGPNCLGVINTHPEVCMNATFARKMPRRGNIAFISQSGALCTSVLDFAEGRHIGFSKFVSFGNKADVSEIDFLHYLKDDPDTKVILMYLEDISDGCAFMEIAREITFGIGKPILVVKSGRSAEGARAAASHTGSLAGSDATYDAIFLQSGIQRVEGINELFHYALAFSQQPLPKGNRIAIVTNAGGPGIMATDAAIRHGIGLASFSDTTKEKLRNHLPPTASIHNPVDVIGDATHERYEAAIRDILRDESVDGAIVILTPQAMTDIVETAQILPRVAKDIHKPILGSFMGLVDVSDGVSHLEQNGIPNYVFPEAAARTMAAMVRFSERLQNKNGIKREIRQYPVDKKSTSEIIKNKLSNNKKYYMPENEAGEILKCYGIPLLKSQIVKKEKEISDVIDDLGLPVAMKIISPDILHKSDAGGVRINISTRDQAQQAFLEIMKNSIEFNPQARIEGILVEEMAQDGVEVIIGATRDPMFGPICMFGMGGIFVEALKDVTFRLAPMWELSAENMIRSIKAAKVLNGFRGKPPSDVEAIKECILRMSQLVSDNPEIQELDINPLIVYPAGMGCRVADCRIILRQQ